MLFFTPNPWGFMIQFENDICSNGLVQPTSFFSSGSGKRWDSKVHRPHLCGGGW